jgi:ankyrin repeat protein
MKEDAFINLLSSQDGRAAIHWAALNKDGTEIVKFLLEQKADVSRTDPNGWTALHIAGVSRGSVENHGVLIRTFL